MSLLDAFLRKNKVQKGEQPTHTRIPGSNCYGGSYLIPIIANDEFFKLYHRHVIMAGNVEHLTEKQIEEGPLVFDLDFRYRDPVRAYTTEDIIAFIHAVYDELKRIFTSVGDIPIYVMEKTNINANGAGRKPTDAATAPPIKDGIHLIFGVNMDKICKNILRTRLLRRLDVVWERLHPFLTNNWEEVLDRGVMLGTTNWQMYGSTKPGCEPYKLTRYFTIECSGETTSLTHLPVPSVTLTVLHRLSVQYREYPTIGHFVMNPEFQIQYDEERAPRRNGGTTLTVVDRTNDHAPDDIGLATTDAELDAMIEQMFETLTIGEMRFQHYYKSMMLLPAEYYGPGSYDKWIRVGFALKNTSTKLFPCWVKFCSQDSRFSFAEVPELYNKWVSWNLNPEGLSYRSILFWARKADPDGYQRVIQETKSHYVDAIIRSPISAEYEIACLLHHCFPDFKCASVRNSLWYEFKDHRWQVTDSGIALRSKISTPEGLYGIFHAEHLATIMSDDGSEQVARRLKRLDNILLELRRNERKNAIMKEALEVYHDATFLEKLDSLPYITCFTNCVVDLRRDPALGFHRPGVPEDYCSKCTNIPYFPLTHEQDPIVDEIEGFFAQLFPNAELRAYVWQHMAATMVGKVLQQCFYIYLGLGCNGKSKFVRLQEMTLGDLKATVPISMVTSSKRPSTGQATSEVAQLVNIRYAVMQEPSRNDRINEGVLKEITGGDMIQARQLFRESFTFKPKFQLAACMNYLFEGTNENDGGFWRRIRIIEFASYFTDNPVDDDPLRPYQFYLDRDIEEKFERWKLVYAAMLVKHAAIHMGKVDDCPVVMARVEEYRQEQDVFSDFIRCSIQPASHGTLLQTELVEAFGVWWRGSHSKDSRPPSNSDLFTYMNRRFGSKIKPQGAAAHWRGLMILRPDPEVLMLEAEGAQTAEI